MEKKKVNVFSILIYLVLAFFIGFMIYYLVGYNSSGYRAVSTSDGIGYIVNKEDKYVITEARTVKNGDNLGVYLTISEETNKDNKTKIAFTMLQATATAKATAIAINIDPVLL